MRPALYLAALQSRFLLLLYRRFTVNGHTGVPIISGSITAVQSEVCYLSCPGTIGSALYEVMPQGTSFHFLPATRSFGVDKIPQFIYAASVACTMADMFVL